MRVTRIHKKVYFCCEMMIAHFNNRVLLSHVVYQVPDYIRNPFPISLQIRCFNIHDPKFSIPVLNQRLNPISASPKSKVVRTEAQEVLFDYLHSTRSFSFTDAEHISKNSPYFLESLLSKIDGEKDVSRSLTKFLRFNPFNEFEPFFESLGLSPSEIPSILPRLMFLSDDDLMLHNFHVLCDYGVPRCRIGMIYSSAKEIFEYGYGVLGLKLRAYENLGLSKTTVIKLVSCSPSLLIGGVDTDFVEVVEKLKILTLRNDWIGGYVYKDLLNWRRILDTIVFLEQVGYNEDQLMNLLKTNPGLVFEGSGKKTYILFGTLLKLGMKMDETHSLFLENPKLLMGKYAKNLLHVVHFLFDIKMAAEDIARIISIHAKLVLSCSLKGPNTVFKELKVGREGLRQIIMDDSLKLFSLASKKKLITEEPQDQSKRMAKTSFLLKLGYAENSDDMVKAMKKFRGRADQLQGRFDYLVQAGLEFDCVVRMIRQVPTALNQSQEATEKKIDYLRNCLGYPIESLVGFPTYLCYDLERIQHRFSMYMWLRDRNVAKPMLSLSTILACSDVRFVKYFVDVHPQGPAMWATLKKLSTSSKG